MISAENQVSYYKKNVINCIQMSNRYLYGLPMSPTWYTINKKFGCNNHVLGFQ